MIYPSLGSGSGSGRDQPKRHQRRVSGGGGGRSPMMIEDDDLASLIFCRLPARSVLRFRCVSRRLLSLTSEPSFLRLHTLSNPHPPIAGLIVKSDFMRKILLQAHPIPIGGRCPVLPDPSLLSFSSEVTNRYKDIDYLVSPLDTCSGLILVKGPSYLTPYYVCNPTTMEFRQIPDPPIRRGKAMALFFDPSSPACRTPILHYKLIYISIVGDVAPSRPGHRYEYRIFIYTSLTGSWTPSGKKPFTVEGDIYVIDHARSAACSGAVHWPSNWPYRRLLSFSVESERFWVTPFPPSPFPGGGMMLDYFGSSPGGNRLHLIERYRTSSTLLYIYELKEDHSGWLLLYTTKLMELQNFLPRTSFVSQAPPVCFLRKVQDVAGGGGGGEKDLLVINLIDGCGKMKLITYDLQKNIYSKEVSQLPGSIRCFEDFHGLYRWTSFTPSAHSLYPLNH